MNDSPALSIKTQLVGTWTLVSFESISDDGKKKAVFGAQPKGILMIDANGHYALVLADSLRPKFKSDLRTQTTAEEYAAAAKGFVAQFGIWSVDETSKTFIRKLDAGLNPNSAGTEQKATVAFSGDELRIMNSSSTITAGSTLQIYQRVK